MARTHDKQPPPQPEPEMEGVDLDYEFACFLIEQKGRLVRETIVALVEKGEITVASLLGESGVHQKLADALVAVANITFKGLQEG